MKLQLWQWLVVLFVLSMLYETANSLSLKGILGEQSFEQSTLFKQVLMPRKFVFPQDHLAHQSYKTEWWYFTGNLNEERLIANDSPLKFSYQFTLFRFALRPEASISEKDLSKNSQWRSNNIYMAHVALTDIQNQKIYQQERFSRDGLKLAGAEINDDGLIQFWLNDWQVQSMQANQLFPLKLVINNAQFSLNLQLETNKPMVLQGNKGLSQKNNSNASYYYSYTRLETKGSILLNNKNFKVSGDSWFDREWSTSSLGVEQKGWDWFALHLDDGSELMIYQMRKKDGIKDSYSSGILIDSQGNTQTLQAKQFQLKVNDSWLSPVSGVRYPIVWEIIIPEKEIKLMISSSVKEQEWSKNGGFSFNYWEGSIQVKGIKKDLPVSGTGYLEMTGYD